MKLQLFLAALLLASTAVHEAGHWLAGRLFGYRVIGLRWIPPGIHLRGPRGPNAVAPTLEAVIIAIAGPVASLAFAGALWHFVGPATAFLCWLCGGLEWVPFIPHTDGWRIWQAIAE